MSVSPLLVYSHDTCFPVSGFTYRERFAVRGHDFTSSPRRASNPLRVEVEDEVRFVVRQDIIEGVGTGVREQDLLGLAEPVGLCRSPGRWSSRGNWDGNRRESTGGATRVRLGVVATGPKRSCHGAAGENSHGESGDCRLAELHYDGF